jgi:prepilin-type N-terminal cleavage/methylation domain-containing protein
MKQPRQSGFSLVELLVALTVTMIVSGAVYGLLASGQGAFRKEPALSDRQANIRSAMDQIVKELSGAGAAMPPFAQVFAPGLNNAAGGPNAVALPGEQTDELMILTDTTGASPQLVCNSTATSVEINENIRPLEDGQSVTIFLADNRWTVRVVTSVVLNVGAAGTCTGPHARINFVAGPVVNVGGGFCAAGGVGTAAGAACTAPLMMSGARVVAYRIRPDAAGVPFLEQQTSENWGVWQPVFPGIEDLQVRYQDGVRAALAPPADFIPTVGPVTIAVTTAPTVVELDSLVRRVEVTLSARTVAGNLTGQSTSVGAGSATRGTLQTVTTMRPVLETMSQAGLPPPYPRRF